jgi:hypothetical protein
MPASPSKLNNKKTQTFGKEKKIFYFVCKAFAKAKTK